MIIREARDVPCFGRDVLKNEGTALAGFESMRGSAGQERTNGNFVNAFGTDSVILGIYFLLSDGLVDAVMGDV